MDKDLEHIEFVMYCIETYKAHNGIDGKQAYVALKTADAIRFVDKNYESLHTFGDAEIVRNIDEYLKNRRQGFPAQ
ncbi:MAG: DUF3791 domain-containing protein [Oscillospiraceae bacterium]|jgi:hypothetical protein|nr:DUF3791 domain-containing protein [Oscillospiraceae bacterium]